MLDVAFTCRHCGTINTIVEVGTEPWEEVNCSHCKLITGTLHDLAHRHAEATVRDGAAKSSKESSMLSPHVQWSDHDICIPSQQHRA